MEHIGARMSKKLNVQKVVWRQFAIHSKAFFAHLWIIQIHNQSIQLKFIYWKTLSLTFAELSEIKLAVVVKSFCNSSSQYDLQMDPKQNDEVY